MELPRGGTRRLNALFQQAPRGPIVYSSLSGNPCHCNLQPITFPRDSLICVDPERTSCGRVAKYTLQGLVQRGLLDSVFYFSGEGKGNPKCNIEVCHCLIGGKKCLYVCVSIRMLGHSLLYCVLISLVTWAGSSRRRSTATGRYLAPIAFFCLALHSANQSDISVKDLPSAISETWLLWRNLL